MIENRRQQILMRALVIARRRRMRRRGLPAMAMMLLVTILVIAILPHHPSPRIMPIAQRPIALPPPRSPAHREIVITSIETDPTLADRLAVKSEPGSVRILNDDEFLEQLAAAGKPAGLQYSNGDEQILWRSQPPLFSSHR